MTEDEEIAAALRIKCPVCRTESGPCYYRPSRTRPTSEAVVHTARIIWAAPHSASNDTLKANTDGRGATWGGDGVGP